MDATRLETLAIQESTYVITVPFKDDAGTAVAPSAATWTLCKSDGTVINSRNQVAITTPQATEEITLSGDDLAITETGSDRVTRFLIVEWTYTGGTGRDQASFELARTAK